MVSFHPVHHLPDDVLSLIFLQCATEPLCIPFNLTQSPWPLSRVCSRWRNVALFTHDLWNRLNIRCTDLLSNDNRGVGPSYHSVLIKDILSRSGCTLLSLDIACETDNLDSSNQLDWLLPYVHRIRDLHLSGAGNSLFGIAPHSFPNLESLWVDDELIKHSEKLDFSTLQGASQLREVTFYFPFSLSAGPSLLPLSRLTTLMFMIDNLLPHQALSILTQCYALVKCHISVREDLWDDWDDNHDAVDGPTVTSPASLPLAHTLPFLTWFLIRGEPEHVPDLASFKLLNLPSLRYLELFGVFRNYEWLPAATSGGFLETFSVTHSYIPTHIVERILEQSPQLSTLKISYGAPLSPAIFQSMATGDLGPRLAVLECEVDKDEDQAKRDVDLLLDMAEARKLDSTPAAELMEVHIAAPLPLFKVKPPRFKKLVENGWNMSILPFCWL